MVHLLHRSPPKPTISHEGDAFVVRFVDGSGRRHEQRFRTRREARFFAHLVRTLPPDESFDRAYASISKGLFARNVGAANDVSRGRYR